MTPDEDIWRSKNDIAEIESLRSQIAELEKVNNSLRSALTEIANIDYRGNRSTEQNIAYRALKGA